MATIPTGTTTTGHEDFEHPQDVPGKTPPLPGTQPAGTSPLTGTGTGTGTKPPGWMRIFMMLLTSFSAAYVLDCKRSGRVPDAIDDSILKMLETQADHICARYPKEISVATF
jgi:hypothetical protein